MHLWARARSRLLVYHQDIQCDKVIIIIRINNKCRLNYGADKECNRLNPYMIFQNVIVDLVFLKYFITRNIRSQ